jgi:type II secretory ATPase GspE/PulE/Tfp pilus assembly ATPase PilB-like protein
LPNEDELGRLVDIYLSDFLPADTPETAPPSQVDLLKDWRQRFADKDGKLRLFRAKGCPECDDTGYKGRIAVHELLASSRRIRGLIAVRALVTDIRLHAMSEGMRTLRQDGIFKMLLGKTDLAQLKTLSAD